MSNTIKKKILVFGIIIAILIFAIYQKNLKNKNPSIVELNEISDENFATEVVDNQAQKEIETIKIHISGEVNNPGLIELKVGDRVADAIELAGGLTNNADVSKINLAYILSDGEKIYVPNFDEQEDSNSKININTANSSQLQEIPGVGEATAASIIEFRNTNRKVYFNWRT